MKTREEEIKQAYENWRDNYIEFSERTVWECACGWADEHPKNSWREAVKDPPKNDDNVIIFIHGKICEGYFNVHDKYWYCREFGYIETPRYWMPTPKLPKGGEK